MSRRTRVDAATAHRALLLRELETAQPPSPLWTAQDRAWATQLARAADATGAEEASTEAFIAERTRVAWQRLGPRLQGQRAATWHAPGGLWAAVAAALGLLLGLGLDALGSGGTRINLLAPPLWGVVAWNLLVYASLVWLALWPPKSGAWPHRLGQAWARRRSGLAAKLPGAAATVEVMQPLAAARVTQAFHLAAAGLGLGLLIGLYWRGLVWDYRATWESTFLTAEQVAAFLGAVLAPASIASGIALPGAADLAALRLAPQSAGPWIHLFAWTLGLFVLIPRLLLAAWAGWRARRLAQHFPLDLGAPYFCALARQAQTQARGVWLLPHGLAPTPAVLARASQSLGPALGEGLPAHWGPACLAGEEDAFAAPGVAPPGHAVVACVDMAATPEAQTQGRWLERLQGAAAPTLLWVDAAAFSQRFGHLPQRLAERRRAWAEFAAQQHLPCVFSDEDAAAALVRSA